MPLLSMDAHPNGPEKRPFSERTLVLRGQTHQAILSFAHPAPEDSVDWTDRGLFWVGHTRNPTPPWIYWAGFDYKGWFWQGRFGSVGISVILDARQPHEAPWSSPEIFFHTVQMRTKDWNNENKLKLEQTQRMVNVGELPKTTKLSDSDQERTAPKWVEVNGVRWAFQYENSGTDPKDFRWYTFPIDADTAVKIRLKLTDNSHRPGLTKSDWRPRAEAFAQRLLSTIKIRIEPNPPQ